MPLPFAEQLRAVPESDAPRHAAALRFAEIGLPTPRNEGWKYTNLAFLSARAVSGVESTGEIPTALVEDTPRLAFVDGIYRPDLSATALPDGVTIHHEAVGLHAALEPHAIAQLNAALCGQAVTLRIADHAVIAQPIELCFVGHGSAVAHAALSIVAGVNARATIVERHVCHGGFTGITRSLVDVGQGASLKHYRLHEGSTQAVSLAIGTVDLAKDAAYEAFSLSHGGQVTRHQVIARFNGEGGHLELNGAHVVAGDSHIDTTTEIQHATAHCASRETYRHVMDGNGRSVFQGKIFVAEGAQKTDGFQLNQSLMLSPTAEVNAKPELEIYADDVKCSHGATSGRLDAEALFYLRSRGLPAGEARALLVRAFIASAIDLISDETVRAVFTERAAHAWETTR